MNIGKRLYWVVALVAMLALAGAAVTLTSQFTSAGGSTPAAQTCADQEGVDEPAEAAATEADTDTVDQQCGDQNEAEDGNNAADDQNEAEDGNNAADDQNEAGDGSDAADGEVQVPAGTLDDGKDLLPQAAITIDAAIVAAQSAAPGPVGEVDLEHVDGKLVYNVDIGDKDVKVDASNGSVMSAVSDD